MKEYSDMTERELAQVKGEFIVCKYYQSDRPEDTQPTLLAAINSAEELADANHTICQVWEAGAMVWEIDGRKTEPANMETR